MLATVNSIPSHCAFDVFDDTDTLIPKPRNPNQHPEEQIRRKGTRRPAILVILDKLLWQKQLSSDMLEKSLERDLFRTNVDRYAFEVINWYWIFLSYGWLFNLQVWINEYLL